jgi:magnesium transporter
VVGLSIFFVGIVATGLGFFFPWFLKKVGLDPAFGSGPLATVVQDILSILIFFYIARIAL